MQWSEINYKGYLHVHMVAVDLFVAYSSISACVIYILNFVLILAAKLNDIKLTGI